MNLLWWRKKKLKDFTLTIIFDKSLKEDEGTFQTETKVISIPTIGNHIESTLAHELGHVMSMILRTPITRKAELYNSKGNIIAIKKLCVNEELICEEEAWAFARIIIPEKIDEKFAEYALRTHGKNI